MRKAQGPALSAVLAAALFAAATPLAKLLLREMPTAQLAGLLYVGGAIGLLPVVSRGIRDARHLGGRGATYLTGAIVCGGILGPLLMLLGLQLASAASVSLWLNMELVATAVLGHLLFREHLTRSEWFGVTGVVLAGLILSGVESDGGLIAAALVSLACICWAIDNHLTALIDGMTPAQATFWKCAVAGAVNLGIGVMSAPFTASASTASLALGVGAFSYGLSIVLYITAAQQLGATRAQMLFATAPLFGVALSAILLGETLTAAHAAATLIMIASVAIMFAARHEHVHAHEAVAHTHIHRHDDGHHLHDHDDQDATAHAHWHEHEPTVHAHHHLSDLHHRHHH